MRVEAVQFGDTWKAFRLANGTRLTLHRFCCLGPGDEVVVRSSRDIVVKCANGEARISRPYRASDKVIVAGRRISLTVKEIEDASDLRGYEQLAQFHYRGKQLHGRRVPLVIIADDPLLPRVLGYVELATAFLMNRRRAELLDAPFAIQRGLAWESWRKDTVRKYTNLIVRIARTVVSPEFRGLGLAAILVKHAARFARTHWNVGGLKPLFMEITADMLRYVPFVERAGMRYIGETEGNLGRLNKDMNYVLANLRRVRAGDILNETTAGIVDLQVSYATTLARIQRRHKLDRKTLLDLLLTSPHRLSDNDWAMLHRVYRLPKPTFFMGLTAPTRRFVARRVRALGLPEKAPLARPASREPRIPSAIIARNCSFDVSASVSRTPFTRKVQQAFGVDKEMLRANLFSDLSFEIAPGSVVLICGPSGAGKTTLLSVLRHRLERASQCSEGFRGRLYAPKDLSVSVLAPLSGRRPLVNSLGTGSFEHALFALNVSGLAEAHLYVKRFAELSNGQRYRAMIAKLIASDVDVWVADEFCANLDPITAAIVARNLRRCAKSLGVTVLLAAASWGAFIEELQPDVVVHLRAPWDHKVFDWTGFRASLLESSLAPLAVADRS